MAYNEEVLHQEPTLQDNTLFPRLFNRRLSNTSGLMLEVHLAWPDHLLDQ
jgi:hypothetical protein